MNISDNIRWITSDFTLWKFYTNRSYRAKIQCADLKRIYNVPGKAGVVYNCLEDSFEKVGENGYVVTGILGEMWPIGEKAVKKYNVDPKNITAEPMEVDTVELDTVYAAIRIPSATQFTLEVDYGEKAVLRGNRPGIGHGDGDYILIATKIVDGEYVTDFNDSGRIINGSIFDKLYKKYEP
ncbi:hypothetical protein [Ruminococcus albus]|uniref:Uncharacterized protein n=1 Tax=Ruminococcus albus TaxID=1264 RepID=A0A1H7PJE6_RUMAL|nr:hypothetical protein [Ruminococcus albus]SEL35736.1 hypothetical protein SAMN05216469_12214 [Ruminococcus albus]